VTATDRPRADAFVIALGSINDHVFRIPGAPTGTVIAEDLGVRPGGKAANAAVVARHLGARVALFGWVGDDEAGRLAVAGPQAVGVDVTAVGTVSGPTGSAAVLVEPDGGKTIIRVPGANGSPVATSGAVLAALRAAADGAVLIADLEVPAHIVHDAVAAAGGRGVRTVLDPAPPEAVTAELLASAHVVTPDHTEAQALTGTSTDSDDGAVRAAVMLQAEGGAPVAMVKLASGGCALAWDGGRGVVEPPPVGVVDTNGAGDAFAGAVAWAIGTGVGPVDAARIAVAASTLATTERGGQLARFDRQRLERLRDQSRFDAA
jgi:ribokinase